MKAKLNESELVEANAAPAFDIQKNMINQTTCIHRLRRLTRIGLFVFAWAVAQTDTAKAATSGPEVQPMNVVMILADDMRWDAFGAGGSDFIHTPNLDRLAEQNVQFTNAYVTTSICNVSRASILTGQHMEAHGVDRFGKTIDAKFDQSYPGVLREAGYWSGHVGKDHLEVATSEHFDFVRSYELHHWFEIDGERVHVTERNARDSMQFLQERPKDRPFLLNLSFFAPHAEDRNPKQYLPQDWSARHYRDVVIPESEKMHHSYLEALPDFLSQPRNEGRKRFDRRFTSPQHYQESMTNYFRLITEIDAVVGQVIEELKAQGVYENTLIIFAGDNGYFHADRGLADKWYPYEESIRVPLLIHDPRLPRSSRGIQREQMVLNIDIAPTIVQAVGLPVPKTMQGVDLAPLYLGDSMPPWREEFFYSHPTISYKERIPTSQAVVREDMKYVYWPEWSQEQLFDLRSDPTEKHNQAENSDYAAQLEFFRARLQSWLEWAESPEKSEEKPFGPASTKITNECN